MGGKWNCLLWDMCYTLSWVLKYACAIDRLVACKTSRYLKSTHVQRSKYGYRTKIALDNFHWFAVEWVSIGKHGVVIF